MRIMFIRMSIPTFHPEYGRYMLESTPGSPYTGSIQDLLSVETNMHYRRALPVLSCFCDLISNTRRLLAKRHINANEVPLTVTSFPRLGAPGVFTDPYFSPDDAKSSHSLFLPEEITNPHARFPSVALFCLLSQSLYNDFTGPLLPTLEPGEVPRLPSIFLFSLMRRRQGRSSIQLYRGNVLCTQKIPVRLFYAKRTQNIF